MFLTDNQIDMMADAALTTFEVSGDKQAAIRAARDFAIDEFNCTPRKSAVLLAFKQAMLRWEGIKMGIRQ